MTLLFFLIAVVLLIPPVIMATEVKREPGWIFIIFFWIIFYIVALYNLANVLGVVK